MEPVTALSNMPLVPPPEATVPKTAAPPPGACNAPVVRLIAWLVLLMLTPDKESVPKFVP
jgi:hypothetical protein